MISGLRRTARGTARRQGRARGRLSDRAVDVASAPLGLLAGAAGSVAGAGSVLRHRLGRHLPDTSGEAEQDAPEAEHDAPEAEHDAPEAEQDAPEAEQDTRPDPQETAELDAPQGPPPELVVEEPKEAYELRVE